MVVRDYHRPSSLDEAFRLLARAGVTTVLVGGGTTLAARGEQGPVEIVDLQGLDLDGIELENGRVRIGAMARLQALVDHASVPPMVRDLAKREAASTFRNVATVGGTLAAGDYESVLLAGFLAHRGVVGVAHASGSVELPLPDLLADRSRLDGGIITNLTMEAEGSLAYAATGRTPADRPIVAAVLAGIGSDARVALTGVAATPVMIEPSTIADLEPPGDFRGSSRYRKELARVLTERLMSSQTA
jgi:CO/xanthine dehydrogenase FAD-binding subunit